MKKASLAFLFTVCLFVFPVTAQIITNPTQWYVNNQIYSMRVFNSVMANSMLTKGSKGKTNRSNQAKSVRTEKDFTVFSATPNNSLSKQLAGKINGGNQREAEQIFNSFVSLYQQTAQKDGFPSNDLAYAFEYFVVNNYQIYRDLMDLPLEKDPWARRAKDGFERISLMRNKKLAQITLDQERAIYNQFKEMLGSNAEIKKMTDAQKQEAAELLAIMFGVNYTAYMKGINDDNDELTEQSRQTAKQGLEKLLGASADQIKITGYGLEL